MRKFKRFLFVFILMVSTMVVTACVGAKETKGGLELLKTMELKEDNGISIVIRYYGKGDISYIQTANNIIPYTVLGGNKEAAKKQLDPIAAKYEGLKGVKYNLEYGDEGITEELEIDYRAVEPEKLEGVPGIILNDGDPRNGISVTNSVDLLKNNGFVEKK